MPTAVRSSKKKSAAAAAAVASVVASADVALPGQVIEVEAVAPVQTAPAPEPVAPAPAAPAPKKKSSSSSKKPVKVVAVVTADGIEGSFTPEPRRPLIAHLQIKTNEVVFHDQVLRYDPNPPSQADPEPYDAAETDFFMGGQEPIISKQEDTVVEQKGDEKQEVNPVSSPPVGEQIATTAVVKAMPCFTKANLMVQFKDSNEQKELPERTNIACFWDAHTFDWTPCVIPEREVNGVYQVYGNFCSPQCALAHLLSEVIDPHVRWERVALLQRIYDPDGKSRVFPAGARECLHLFGGPMTIEVFRKTMSEGRVRVDLHMPPMVSILGSIDTKPIDFFDTNLKGGGNLPVNVPQRSVEEGLRLQRKKPLKERESTLDSVMNIKIGGARRL